MAFAIKLAINKKRSMSIPFVTIYAGLGRFHKLKAMLLTIPIVKKSIPTVLTFVAVLPFLYETPMAVIQTNEYG